MQETADLIFHLEPVAAPGLMPTGPLVLQGWVYGRRRRHIVDLRARYRGRIFPAVFGLPRADLAQYFQHHRPQLMAGFDLGLVLAPGENRVELQALDLSGQWLSLGSHPVTAPSNPAPAPETAVAIHPDDFFRAVRLLLRRAGKGGDLAQLADTLAGELPVPQVTRYPHFPFHGHLHHPALVVCNHFGRTIVEGWLFHETLPIRRVVASYDLLAWQTLEYGAAMPDVARMFPQFTNARTGGIHGQVDLPAQLPSPPSLRIYAEMADGAWELCHLQRSHVHDAEDAKVPFGPRSVLTFLRASRLLRSACRQRGFRIDGGRLFRQGLKDSLRDYWGRAPRRRIATDDSTLAPPAAASAAPAPRSVVLVTHSLGLEGAPLFLLELARHLAAAGTALTVISASDGPLRADFARLPASIHLVETGPLMHARGARALRRALATLEEQVDLRGAGVVVANTLSAFWGVQLAARAGVRSLFYIHESTTPERFYQGRLAAAVLQMLEESFTRATHVSFLAEATRDYYRPMLTQPNHSLNPGWVDLAQIDRFRAANPRAALRHRLGFDPATKLVLNLGTVCERKGQHIFARAVEQLWREQPGLAATARFLIVGARQTPFDAAMVDLLHNLGRPNLQLVRETDAPYEYFGAADLFVSSSYEESFPRVILEAMAFELPILATGVHGVPGMSRPGWEAELVPPGDSLALAQGLIRLLQDPGYGQRLAGQGRVRVAAQFDSAQLLPRHAALVRAVASSSL